MRRWDENPPTLFLVKNALAPLIAVLVLSLGLNAWQYSQRPSANPPGSDQAPSKGKDQRPLSGSESTGASSPKGASKGGVAPSDLGQVLAMSDPLARYEAMIAFVRGINPGELEATLAEIRMGFLHEGAEGRLLAHLLLTRWAQEDPEAALASLRAGSKQTTQDAQAILAVLARTDPAQASAWLSDQDNAIARNPKQGYLLARTIGLNWSTVDAEASMAWAAGLPEHLRAGAYSGVLGTLVEKDPARAARIASELPPTDRASVIGEIAERWALNSPEEALAWANSLEGSERRNSLTEALGAWTRQDPQAAAGYLEGLPAPEQAEHVANVARTWSREDPANAAEWLGAQPESAGKVEAIGFVMWDWTNADPQAAAEWLGEQERGASYDRGVTGLAKAAVHTHDDPSSGVEWAASIEDQGLRETMLNHTLREWSRAEPAAAREWAEANGVEPPASRDPFAK